LKSERDERRKKCLDRVEVRREWSEKLKLVSISRCGQRACAATGLQRVKSCAER
jgi:hypothetical protein